MVDVPSAVAGLATSMRLFREIGELAQRGETAEAFEKLGELQRRYAEATGRLAELEAEVRGLRAERELRESMHWDHNVYWRREGETWVGPFCPSCLDGQGRPARMADRDGTWLCPVCNHLERSPERRERDAQRARAQRRQTRAIGSGWLERW